MKPFEIKYGGMTYRVEQVGDLQGVMGEPLYGQVDFTTNIIKIRDVDAKPIKRVTLLHELLHIILAHSGRDHDEGQIDAIAYGLAALLTENPNLVKQLATLAVK